MNTEYETLRSELLQVYNEQSNLAFVTAIASAAILFGLLGTSVPEGIGVAVWEIVLTGIGWKLSTNYDRLYRIGTYLKVVHELKGRPNHTPLLDEPAWHFRSRLIGMRQLSPWRWGSGAWVDARFLRLLGFSGVLFVILTFFSSTTQLGDAFYGLIAIGCFVFLYRQTRGLYALKDHVVGFENALWQQISKGEDPGAPGEP